MIDVMIVDDQRLLLEGLQAILETDREIRVIAIASNGSEAIKNIEIEKPHVILMDIRMPEMDGVECTRQIKVRWPELKILMLTTFDDKEYISDALKFGASGYLLKDISGDKLIRSIKDAYVGDILLPGKIAAKIVDIVKENNVAQESVFKEKLRKKLLLSDRETDVAVMLSEGFTNRQIASALYISDGTVKNYVSSIYGKLEVADRASAVIKLRSI